MASSGSAQKPHKRSSHRRRRVSSSSDDPFQSEDALAPQSPSSNVDHGSLALHSDRASPREPQPPLMDGQQAQEHADDQSGWETQDSIELDTRPPQQEPSDDDDDDDDEEEEEVSGVELEPRRGTLRRLGSALHGLTIHLRRTLHSHKDVTLNIEISSPPQIDSDGRAPEADQQPIRFTNVEHTSMGAVVAGMVTIDVAGHESVAISRLSARLRARVDHLKPFKSNCAACKVHYRPIWDRTFLDSDHNLEPGRHQFSFDIYLPGHLPASIDTPLNSISYELDAELTPQTSDVIKTSRNLVIQRTIPIPRNRITKQLITGGGVCVRGAFPIAVAMRQPSSASGPPLPRDADDRQVVHLELTNVTQRSADACLDIWELGRVRLRLEEDIMTYSPACGFHAPPPNEDGATRQEHRLSRTLYSRAFGWEDDVYKGRWSRSSPKRVMKIELDLRDALSNPTPRLSRPLTSPLGIGRHVFGFRPSWAPDLRMRSELAHARDPAQPQQPPAPQDGRESRGEHPGEESANDAQQSAKLLSTELSRPASRHGGHDEGESSGQPRQRTRTPPPQGLTETHEQQQQQQIASPRSEERQTAGRHAVSEALPKRPSAPGPSKSDERLPRSQSVPQVRSPTKPPRATDRMMQKHPSWISIANALEYLPVSHLNHVPLITGEGLYDPIPVAPVRRENSRESDGSPSPPTISPGVHASLGSSGAVSGMGSAAPTESQAPERHLASQQQRGVISSDDVDKSRHSPRQSPGSVALDAGGEGSRPQEGQESRARPFSDSFDVEITHKLVFSITLRHRRIVDGQNEYEHRFSEKAQLENNIVLTEDPLPNAVAWEEEIAPRYDSYPTPPGYKAPANKRPARDDNIEQGVERE